MTPILFIAVAILFVMLTRVRGRLNTLEQEVQALRGPDAPGDAVRRSAVIVVDGDPWRTVEPAAAATLPPIPDPAPPEPATPEAPAPVMSDPSPAMPLAETTPPVVASALTDSAGHVDHGEPASAPAPQAAQPAAMPDPEMPVAAAVPATSLSSGFEDLFGRKLPIWAGGITLVVAAVLLVKYSIDAGLLSPVVRVVLGLLFGAGLIGAAELARRNEARVRDPRIAQALGGAGIGSLYAATLAAANLYALIGPQAAFAGLTAVTALALGLALRLGAPCAVLGLIGGLATPALVASSAPNVPLLSGYLAIVLGSLTVLSRRQRWFWLGASALIGGAGWTGLLIIAGLVGQPSEMSVGLLVLLLGILLPVFASDDHRGPALRAIAAVIAAFQLAVLVVQGGYAPLTWGLYGLLALSFVWLTGRLPALRPMIVVPLATALILAGLWPAPAPGLFALVMAGIVLIFAGTALWRLWRPAGDLVEASMIIAVALGGYGVNHGQFAIGHPERDTMFAALALAFALLPAAGAAMGLNRPDRRDDIRFALLTLAAGLLVAIAALVGLPEWTAPAAIALVAALLLAIGRATDDAWVPRGALLFLGGALGALLVSGEAEPQLMRLGTTAALVHPAQAMLRWALAALCAAAFAWHYRGTLHGRALQALAALVAYGFVAQFVPAPWLAMATAVAAAALAEAMRRGPAADLTSALLALAAVAALWALHPFAFWLLAALASLAGDPMYATVLPTPGVAIRRLVVPALLGGVALWRLRDRLRRSAGLLAGAQIGIIGLIGLHILYKQLFALAEGERFIAHGVAERTLWEAMLIAAGVALWRLTAWRQAALVAAAMGLGHNLLYAQLLHNPLWSAQAVGPWPGANLLLPCYVIAFGGLWLCERLDPRVDAVLARPVRIVRMLLILLAGFTSLRQLFAGSRFAHVPIGQAENIGWSVLAIAIAIGFLLWGIRCRQRDWRIGSLLLMLAAVAKVFLADAAGLEGLLRIGSFMALGFSLIGIGWLYSRYLRIDPQQENGR